MILRSCMVVVAFYLTALSAATGTLKGVVKDLSNDKPIASAIVRLMGKGLIDTTDNNGNFLFSSFAVSTLPKGPSNGSPLRPRYIPGKGIIFVNENRGHVKVDIFNLSGKVVAALNNSVLEQGIWSMPPGNLANGMYVCKIKSSDEMNTFRFMMNETGHPRGMPNKVGDINGFNGMYLSKKTSSTRIDTLITSKPGFHSDTMPWNEKITDSVTVYLRDTTATVGFSNPSMTGQVSKQIVDQDTGTLNIQVSLSKAFASNVTVPIIVLNGSTANDPLDYTLGSSPIVIPAGDTTDSISLSIVPHESYQLSKTVLLTLGSPTNAKLGYSILDTVIIVDKNGFGRRYRISDNEVTGWKQNTDPNQDTFSLWVGDELFSHIDGGADLYLNRGCLVSMYQYMVGPNGPDSQVCMVIAMDFSTAAQADSMFRLQKETSTVLIPDYESSVAIAYPGILGNITVYAHFKAIYFELMLSGYVDQNASCLIASQLLKVLELKTH